MSLELCILASGSSGNCAVVRTPGGVMLIDLGIGPRVTAQRMDGTGVGVADVQAVCLTHLDSDHFRPIWASTLVKRGIRVYVHRERVQHLLSLVDPEIAPELARLVVPFHVGDFEPLAGVRCSPLMVAHDRTGSHAFVVQATGADGAHGRRLGYATDLGHVPGPLLDLFRDLDVLAIEANYDPQMQLASPRPFFLKNRIMGGSGHLSNQQALDAVRALLDRATRAGGRLPEHIVLLHRSRQCNCPKIVQALFSRDARIGPRLTMTDQYARTEWLRPREVAPAAGEQLTMAFG
jgi:phosphoribosyl 1,2-cyclic phosphodiesterase